MYKRKDFKSKDSNFRKKNMSYEDQQYTPSPASRPPKEDGGEINTTIDVISMRDLPHSSYAVKVDPYTESNNPATPYHLVSRFNKVLGGRYKGRDNLNGGNAIQYNSAVNSKFLKVFDSALIALGLNYKYLPILSSDNVRGKNMVDEMIKAISEIVSSLNATTFKDQNIFYYGVETDMPMGSHVPHAVTINGQTHQVYTDIAEVIYAVSIEYQLILQDIIAAFNAFNANRTRMGTMIRMSWDREVALLNSYFGLLKKKSFLAMFDSLAINLQGEYVDVDWMRQVNTFNMVASRRSNCLNDPLKEIIATHNKPATFRTYIALDSSQTTWANKPVFDYDDLVWTPAGGSPITFDAAVKEMMLRLSVEDTLDWARNVRSGAISELARFNGIKNCLEVLTYCFTIFKAAFTDIRTVLNIMNKIGVVNWALGTRLAITKDTDCEVVNYLVVDNVYQELFGGATEIRYNDVTKRWRTFSLWNLYYGTPMYAEVSGGSFFTFSVKDLAWDQYVTPDNLGYLPIAFTIGTFIGTGSYCVAVNRQGKRAWISRYLTGVTMDNNPIFSRLTPLTSQATLKLNVPTVAPDPGDTFDNDEQAFLYRLLLQVCGIGHVNGDFALDPDILAVYEYEIEDMTNEVISYCRGNGPFRVSSVSDNTLGFYGLSMGTK